MIALTQSQWIDQLCLDLGKRGHWHQLYTLAQRRVGDNSLLGALLQDSPLLAHRDLAVSILQEVSRPLWSIDHYNYLRARLHAGYLEPDDAHWDFILTMSPPNADSPWLALLADRLIKLQKFDVALGVLLRLEQESPQYWGYELSQSALALKLWHDIDAEKGWATLLRLQGPKTQMKPWVHIPVAKVNLGGLFGSPPEAILLEQGIGDELQAYGLLSQVYPDVPIYTTRPEVIEVTLTHLWQGHSACQYQTITPAWDLLTYLHMLPWRLAMEPVQIKPFVQFSAPAYSGDTLRIGICYQGNPQHANDWARSTNQSVVNGYANAVALGVKGPIEFVLLQDTLDFPYLPHDWAWDAPIPLLGVPQEVNTLSKLAKYIWTQVDAVITVDTMVAHLCGAMGKPCLVLHAQTPDVRWFSKLSPLGDGWINAKGVYQNMKHTRCREFLGWWTLTEEVIKFVAGQNARKEGTK